MIYGLTKGTDFEKLCDGAAKADHHTIMKTCQGLGYGFMPWSWTGNNRENAWLDMVDSSDWKTPTWWGQDVIDGEFGIRKIAHTAGVFE